MHPVAMIFGFASFGAIAFSSRGSAVAHGFAWALFCVWACANLAWLYDAMWVIPLVDTPIAMAAYTALLFDMSGWRFTLATAYGFRLPMHLAGAWGIIDLVAYIEWVNLAFLAALVAVSWEGGCHAIGGVVDRVRRLRGVRRMVSCSKASS